MTRDHRSCEMQTSTMAFVSILRPQGWGLGPDPRKSFMSPEITRRTVAKGTAWSAPALMLASATPAVAGSRACAPVTAVWTASATRSSGATNQAGVAATSTFFGGASGVNNSNFTGQSAPAASKYANQNWLMLNQYSDSTTSGWGQNVVITFPQPVYCVSFLVTDIDTQMSPSGLFTNYTGSYKDAVTVAGFTAVAQDPSNTSVNGSTATPTHTATTSGSPYEWSTVGDRRGTVVYSAPGPITTITLTYRNTNPTRPDLLTGVPNNNQQVYISPIQYSTSNCACSTMPASS